MKLYRFLFAFATLASSLIQAEETKPYYTKAGDWLTKIRALYILPDDSSTAVSTIPGSGVSVRPAWTGEFDFGYMFTKHLGSELILATSRHTIMGQKALAGTQIGKTWVLPPTLTLQWRFLPTSRAQPYIGAGVNYTLFYSTNCNLVGTHLKLSHSWGPAAQVGIDIFCKDSWLINFDLKYLWIDTHAYLTGAIPGDVHVNINPWVVGFGIGRKW